MAILFNFCEESGVDGFFQADVSQLPLPPAVMSKLFSDEDLTREDRLQKHHLDSYGGIHNFKFSLFAKVETGELDYPSHVHF